MLINRIPITHKNMASLVFTLLFLLCAMEDFITADLLLSSQQSNERFSSELKDDVKSIRYYVGVYQGSCGTKGTFYRDKNSFIICQHSIRHIQQCPEGTMNKDISHFHPHTFYEISPFCSVNLNDYGYTVSKPKALKLHSLKESEAGGLPSLTANHKGIFRVQPNKRTTRSFPDSPVPEGTILLTSADKTRIDDPEWDYENSLEEAFADEAGYDQSAGDSGVEEAEWDYEGSPEVLSTETELYPADRKDSPSFSTSYTSKESGEEGAASSYTLPVGRNLEPGYSLPEGRNLEPGYSLPEGRNLDPGYSLPEGRNLEPVYSLPDGRNLEPLFSLPVGQNLDPGYSLPEGQNLDPGYSLPEGRNLEPVYSLPEGRNLEPGYSLPEGRNLEPVYSLPEGRNLEPGYSLPEGRNLEPVYFLPEEHYLEPKHMSPEPEILDFRHEFYPPDRNRPALAYKPDKPFVRGKSFPRVNKPDRSSFKSLPKHKDKEFQPIIIFQVEQPKDYKIDTNKYHKYKNHQSPQNPGMMKKYTGESYEERGNWKGNFGKDSYKRNNVFHSRLPKQSFSNEDFLGNSFEDTSREYHIKKPFRRDNFAAASGYSKYNYNKGAHHTDSVTEDWKKGFPTDDLYNKENSFQLKGREYMDRSFNGKRTKRPFEKVSFGVKTFPRDSFNDGQYKGDPLYKESFNKGNQHLHYSVNSDRVFYSSPSPHRKPRRKISTPHKGFSRAKAGFRYPEQYKYDRDPYNSQSFKASRKRDLSKNTKDVDWDKWLTDLPEISDTTVKKHMFENLPKRQELKYGKEFELAPLDANFGVGSFPSKSISSNNPSPFGKTFHQAPYSQSGFDTGFPDQNQNSFSKNDFIQNPFSKNTVKQESPKKSNVNWKKWLTDLSDINPSIEKAKQSLQDRDLGDMSGFNYGKEPGTFSGGSTSGMKLVGGSSVSGFNSGQENQYGVENKNTFPSKYFNNKGKYDPAPKKKIDWKKWLTDLSDLQTGDGGKKTDFVSQNGLNFNKNSGFIPSHARQFPSSVSNKGFWSSGQGGAAGGFGSVSNVGSGSFRRTPSARNTDITDTNNAKMFQNTINFGEAKTNPGLLNNFYSQPNSLKSGGVDRATGQANLNNITVRPPSRQGTATEVGSSGQANQNVDNNRMYSSHAAANTQWGLRPAFGSNVNLNPGNSGSITRANQYSNEKFGKYVNTDTGISGQNPGNPNALNGRGSKQLSPSIGNAQSTGHQYSTKSLSVTTEATDKFENGRETLPSDIFLKKKQTLIDLPRVVTTPAFSTRSAGVTGQRLVLSAI